MNDGPKVVLRLFVCAARTLVKQLSLQVGVVAESVVNIVQSVDI